MKSERFEDGQRVVFKLKGTVWNDTNRGNVFVRFDDRITGTTRIFYVQKKYLTKLRPKTRGKSAGNAPKKK